MIDLRSDTVTKPTATMRTAMANAEVGDDVFREDPSVNRLQSMAAEIFGMEAALYCSSGTQTNQIAISVHTRPGDEVICSELAHVYLYEGGGIAQNAGASVRLVKGDRGRISAADVLANINADDAHFPHSTLVCLENTMNKGGGAIYDFNEILRIREICDRHGMALHCDGARLFNAIVEGPHSAEDFGRVFDSISICLSKGLGAPVGSLLLGKSDFIYKAHRRRKSFGGGMRQAGIIAAAGIYALENNIARLKDDHMRARAIAQALLKMPWIKATLPVDTNIVIAEVAEGLHSNAVMLALGEIGIRCFTFGPDKLRFVTHLEIDDTHVRAFEEAIQRVDEKNLQSLSSVRPEGAY